MTYKIPFIKYDIEGVAKYHCAKCDSYSTDFTPCCIMDHRRICRSCRSKYHRTVFNDDANRIFYNAKQYAKRKQLVFNLSRKDIQIMLAL